jgi:hypothetical protein
LIAAQRGQCPLGFLLYDFTDSKALPHSTTPLPSPVVAVCAVVRYLSRLGLKPTV